MSQFHPDRLEVLYEDNHLIAVLKPAGVLVQGDRSGVPSLMDMTKEYIKSKYGKPGKVFLGLLHRLDRPVSGVVLFARTSKAASRLSEQWRSRSVKKVYWALVHGRMEPPAGTLTSYLKKGPSRVETGFEGARGVQEATLSHRTLRRSEPHSLLEIHLHTGRKHQIRVQLAAAGCPIVGDVKYGGTPSRSGPGLCLTARSLTFIHPTRGEEVTIEAPPPEWASRFLPATGKPPDTNDTLQRRG
ncbi:MAG: RluA family pseudouridine synthase [Deltaproteobacteria bacterium]|nr:RluA family pseudouridine synthase [Deltaproteobacteria bacterium]